MKDLEMKLDAELLWIIQRAHAVTIDRCLRLPQATKMTGLPSASWWKCVKEGTAPSSISLGPRTIAWRESEIQAWIDANTYASRRKRKIDMKLFIVALTANKKET